MNANNKTILIIAFVIVVVLFQIFGAWGMTGLRTSSSMMGGWMMGGISWTWIPIVITLGIGILLGWAIFKKK
jgi:heme/copper-type cytochrome/quinol oxidase subunit 2